MDLPESVRAWRDGGELRYVDNTHLFMRDTGHGFPLVCFHGFPTSSFDWHRLVPLMADQHRVICFDFPGYGLSDKSPEREYTIARQTDAAAALLYDLGIDSFNLLAHDMGVTVACELLRRVQARATRLRPRSVTLLNAGVYMDLHRPLLTQRLLRIRYINRWVARHSSRFVFNRQYPKVYAHPRQFDKEHYDAQWSLLINNQGRNVLHQVAGYMRERVAYGDTWLRALKESSAPVRLIWGLEDPIAVPAIADRIEAELNPEQVVRLTGVGHYPQLEETASVYSLLSEWIN